MPRQNEPDLQPYAGRWVAIISGRVVGSGQTPSLARNMAARVYPKERCRLGWVATDDNGKAILVSRLYLPKIAETLRSLLSQQTSDPEKGTGSNIYFVGGAVRDALLARASHDVDLVMESRAVPLGRWLADQLGGCFYLLDPERGTGRVILKAESVESIIPEGQPIILDLALFRGESLVDDLLHRDFTINAMALPIESDHPSRVIDPLGGQDDLANGIVRATNPNSIREDPIRSLRAVRQAAELGFHIHPDTRKLILQGAGLLPEVATERVRDEICRMFGAAGLFRTLEQLKELDLIFQVFPELSQRTGDNEAAISAPTILDLTLPTILALENLIDGGKTHPAASETPGWHSFLHIAHDALDPYSSFIKSHLESQITGERTIRSCLFLAALLHSAGEVKPTQSESNDANRIDRTNYSVGLAVQRARMLALSNQEVKIIQRTIQLQDLLVQFDANNGNPPSRRSIYRFFREAETFGVESCLLGLARLLGSKELAAVDGWQSIITKTAYLFEHYFHHYGETISPPPLLDGYDLLSQFNLRPGPTIGQLLELVRESQVAGEVKTKQEALFLLSLQLASHS